LLKDEVTVIKFRTSPRQFLFTTAAIAVAVLAAVPPAHTQTSTQGQDMLPPPDTEAAVQSEYARVEAKGTREAYERFIRRHPEHPLVEKAREALAKDGLK
jgi:hypothetical protein